ncbi:MAG: hypothetical protein ACODAC_00005, partial [Pseudomonadota bacterium]
HNLLYWSFGDYVGLGAGAHGKRTRVRRGAFAIERTRKASQPRRYLRAPEDTEHVRVTADEVTFEFMMNALRLADGVPWETFEARTGQPPDVLAGRWRSLADAGLVREERLATTAHGYRYLDSVLERFL